MAKETFGVSIGGPLFDHLNTGEQPSFDSGDYLRTPEIPDAFDALSKLEARFEDRRHVIFKCTPETEERTRAWLAHHSFAARTRTDEEHLHFCRSDGLKLRWCHTLGISHMVDSSFDALLQMRSMRQRFLFRGRFHEIRKHALSLRRVIHVQEWSEILAHLV